MNERSTTPVVLKTATVSMVCVSLCCVLVLSSSHLVGATSSTASKKIVKLSKQIESLRTTARVRNDQTEDVQKRIASLEVEKHKLEVEVSRTDQDLESISKRIATVSSQLDHRRTMLGEVIADQSIETSISPFEMLMSSRSISEYFDRSTYRDALQDSVNDSIKQIKTLNTELVSKQALMKRLQQQQQARIGSVNESIDENNDLLVVIDGQSTHMTKLTKELAAKKKHLQNQQQQQIQYQMLGAVQVAPGTLPKAEASMKPAIKQPVSSSKPVVTPPANKTTVPGPAPVQSSKPTPKPVPKPVTLPNGGYPSYLNKCRVDANALSYGIDPWGYGCRQCVSYAAWKVFQKSEKKAMYWGNANMWPSSAKAKGYKTGKTPKSGSVGVMLSGPYGHVVWVESVNLDGTINISQYNYWLPNKANGGWGYYSEFKNVRPNTYQTYIYI